VQSIDVGTTALLMWHEWGTCNRRIDKRLAALPPLMRATRYALLLAALMLTVILAPVAPVQAAATVDVSEKQGIVGGLSLSLTGGSQNTTMTATFEEMPRIVEVYTATWCENCVGAEHALDDAVEGKDVTMLVHHRYIGETEDPFGSQEGDDRWIARYGPASKESVGVERAPPTMVFDGCRVKAGNVASGDSLQADYEELLVQPRDSAGAVSSELSWGGDNSSGTVSWHFSTENGDAVWTHRLMIVEETAYFPEGGNGLDNYTHIVRQVITLDALNYLPNESEGEVTLDLLEAWDGDDLSLVLVHEWEYEDQPLGVVNEDIFAVMAGAMVGLVAVVCLVLAITVAVIVTVVARASKAQQPPLVPDSGRHA
jgi:hypothetical protein